MHKPNLIVRWTALVAIIFLLFAIGCGGHTTGVTPPPATATPQTILFVSTRALDGSDAATVNQNYNVWTIKEDGSGAKPLTKLTAPSSSSFTPAWSPDGSKIAFFSNGALDGSDAFLGNGNIWVMNADGSGAKPLTKITTPMAGSSSPAWSPDGTKIAFTSYAALDGSDAASPVSNLWMMNADGSGRTPVTQLTAFGTNTYLFVWSPNGQSIAFVSKRALDGSDKNSMIDNIWTVKPDGTGLIPLTNLTAFAAASELGTWSPDGTKIVYGSNRAVDGTDATGGYTNIWVVASDGSSTKPLTEFALYEDVGNPVWSPDGRKIAYSSALWLGSGSAVGGPLNIFAMNADGFGTEPLTRLTASNSDIARFAWSPDSLKIVFDSRRALDGSDAANATSNIWIMNADGTGARPLTTLTDKDAYNGDPTFQP